MTIDQLPTFAISRLEDDRAMGTFDRPLWMGERHLGDLLLPGDRFVCGRFVNVDLQSHRATFVPATAEDIRALQPGTTYPRFDGYWGGRAALVLDRQRHWSQRTFEPVDAVALRRSNGTLVGKASNQNLPEGGTLIKGGWDHEHCDICSKKISPTADPVAMFSEPDHWICRKCYDGFVVPRSLEFIGLQAGKE